MALYDFVVCISAMLAAIVLRLKGSILEQHMKQKILIQHSKILCLQILNALCGNCSVQLSHKEAP